MASREIKTFASNSQLHTVAITVDFIQHSSLPTEASGSYKIKINRKVFAKSNAKRLKWIIRQFHTGLKILTLTQTVTQINQLSLHVLRLEAFQLYKILILSLYKAGNLLQFILYTRLYLLESEKQATKHQLGAGSAASGRMAWRSTATCGTIIKHKT